MKYGPVGCKNLSFVCLRILEGKERFIERGMKELGKWGKAGGWGGREGR
jgi:hypothetical protein